MMMAMARGSGGSTSDRSVDNDVDDDDPPRRGKKKGDAVDRYVGEQVRRFRLMRGNSQSRVAELIGVTFQQIQKYEKGANRISPGRLLRLAELFGVPVADFFPPKSTNAQETAEDPIHMMGQTRDGQMLASAFMRMPDDVARSKLVDFISALADAIPVPVPTPAPKPARKRKTT